MMKDFSGTLQTLFKWTSHQSVFPPVRKALLSWIGIIVTTFIISLFTLSSASLVLLMLRNLYTAHIGTSSIVPLLLYYVLIFVLPFIVLIVVLYFLRKRFHQSAQKKEPSHQGKQEGWYAHYVKVMHFVLGIILFIGGIVLIFQG